MRNFSQILLLCIIAASGYCQQTFNMELVSEVDNGETGNDIWGYVDSTGVEYAIMGTRTRTMIWSLEDPANPVERAAIPGPAGTWRDIKSFEDHIYVTSDQGTDGLLIIDMSEAPETITSSYWKPDLTVDGFTETLEKCHNLYIDTTQGYCYLAGCNIGMRGVLILDLNQDKKNPEHVGTADLTYSHDVYVANDRMYSSELTAGFNIYDVSDKTNPVLLNGDISSFSFTHNAWTSDGADYIFTTDERANAYVESFDISDLDNIQPLDRFKSIETEGQGVIPHNTHYKDGFLITSWYSDGVIINDVHKPDNMIKVAAFDSETATAGGFNGCWGVYPYLPSGLIVATDGPALSSKLKVFRPVDNQGNLGYQRASYLEGNVTDANSGSPIPNVQVSIISTVQNLKATSATGDYKTGLPTAGEYEVMFSHPNYESVTASATIESGEVTILDIEMGNTIITGTVRDAVSGELISDAKVVLVDYSSESSQSIDTDENGNWEIGVRSGVTYGLQVAKWGYKGTTQDIVATMDENYDSVLEVGYEDDFFADLGWSVTGNATSGLWEIAKPARISDSGSLTQTDEDIDGDIGNTYYVTGASGGSIGANDIDNGSVILTSPAMKFDDNANRIDLSYYLWFTNVAGTGTPNDDLTVSLTNGSETIELTKVDESNGAWSEIIEVTVTNDDIDFTDDMRIIVVANDDAPGHVVEAGIDVFTAEGYMSTNTSDLEVQHVGLSVYPNPTSDFIYLNSGRLLEGDNTLLITDINGKVIANRFVTTSTERVSLENLSAGIYNVQLVGSNKKSETLNFVKN